MSPSVEDDSWQGDPNRMPPEPDKDLAREIEKAKLYGAAYDMSETRLEQLAAEKAEFAASPRIREVARNGDYWVQGEPTAGWYASWHPDEVYYRTQAGVWMTSFFRFEEGSPSMPVHKLGPIYEKHTQSNLVDHARRELELVGEEHMTIDAILRIIQAFADMGHSGGSASVVIPWLSTLLNFQNITPLTSNPDEWNDVSGFGGDDPTWQSRRRSDAFSKDGGKTYYLLDEGRDEQGGLIFHTSRPHQKEE